MLLNHPSLNENVQVFFPVQQSHLSCTNMPIHKYCINCIISMWELIYLIMRTPTEVLNN